MKNYMKKSVKRPKPSLKKKSKVQKNLAHIPTKLRKMISSDVFRYLNILGMNHYQGKIFYMKKDVEDQYRDRDGSTLASALVDHRYLVVNINIYPILVSRWKNKLSDDNDIHEVIAHEVSHIATNHMYQMATCTYKDEGETKDAWESLTTIIGRLVHEIGIFRSKRKKL